jgi:MoaA/NifB/PqqE/SkfB family radical SAM enzyme
MTRLNGLHILLTHRCLLECDHCFVWGSPQQSGAMSLSDLLRVLDQARQVPSIRSIYFEGGEPFLFYPLLVEGVRAAAEHGFSVGLVTNGYWATTVEDALLWLAPMAGRLSDVSVSTDLLHSNERISPESRNLLIACEQLGIPASTITCELPAGLAAETQRARGQPIEGGEILFRGRAAVRLSGDVPPRPWASFQACPHEDLEDPERVHLDPLGNLHLCQGLVMGNLFDRPLKEILESYKACDHPVAGPLAAAGPAELVRVYDLPHAAEYADACHLCYDARLRLRARFPPFLGPDAMYGVGLT